MIRKIVSGYKNLFFGAGKILFLLLLCTAIGSAIVLPLWKFATKFPRAYSIFVASLIFIALAIFVFKKIRRLGMKKFLKSFLKFIVVLGGFAICVALVFAGKRFFAIPVMLAMIFLYGLLAFKK